MIVSLACGLAMLALSIVILTDLGERTDTPTDVAGAVPEPEEVGIDLLAPTSGPVLRADASATPTSTPSATLTPSVTATPSLSPSPTTSPTPTVSATPESTPTPRPSISTAPPEPVLLGPSSGRGVSSMAERYCEQHVSGSSWAEPRSDGSWECQRYWGSPRIVDMNVACSDTYGAGAYAQNPGGDAYGWRCYRAG